MARLNTAEGFYVAASRFVAECLRREGSLFTPGRAIWAEEPISSLYDRFVGSPDESKGIDFTTKLLGQLSGAPPDVFQLAAEVYYVLLAPQETDGGGRRAAVEAVLNASTEPVAIPADLLPGLQSGIASYGAALTRRFDQYVFLCEFARAWVGRPPADREALLADPFAFQEFATGVPHKGAQAQVEALIHMVFPDAFEPTVSLDHKSKMAAAFADYVGDSAAPIDRQLQEIRTALTPERGENFSFYDEPLVSQWLTPKRVSPLTGSESAVWMVKAGRSDIHAATVLEDGVISVEWGELDDLGHMNREELASRMRAAFPERPQSTQTRDSNELFAFAHEIEVGDLIVLPQQDAKFAVGRVTGPYEHRPDRPNGGNHARPVDWIRRDVPRSEVQGLNEAIGIRGFTVRKLPNEVAKAVQRFVDGTAEPQDDASSAIHLVVKWTPRYEPRTMELHQEVAEQRGAVWWALFSQAPQAKIAEQSREQLREQLEAGIPTYVFISGPTCWRTRLLAVEADREAVDEDLIPSYYDRVPGRAIVWLKITDFEPVEREELFRLLDPARKPGKPVALGNQANPLFVRIRTTPRYWWVNQGESYQRARSGAFLWAPILDKAGRTKSHWLTMGHLRPGDRVFSYSNSQVRALNEVVAPAVPAPRPDPEADRAWSEEGNRAELKWHDLDPPILLRDIPVEWRTREGGPFAGDGSVNQGYLFPLSDEFVSRMSEQFPQIPLDMPSPPPPAPILEEDYFEPPLADIAASLAAAGMTIDDRTLRRYHLSLKTRGFVVLSGISGTGKTWLAEEYAKAVGAQPLVVPVAPNWTTNEDLLGYLNPLTQQYHDTEFSNFLRDAATASASAATAGRAPRPYHLILDEMNLARVEYYFARFLSAMELRARSENAFIELAPNNQVSLPPNLKFIGTVNVDETTHGFADKVYDRSQLLELTIDADEVKQHLGESEFAPVVVDVWLAMREVAPFAFRVLDEITAYVAEATQEGVPWEESLDEQLLQKVLPKVRGTDPRVGGALGQFLDLSADRFPLSYEKATVMLRAFNEHGYTSYF